MRIEIIAVILSFFLGILAKFFYTALRTEKFLNLIIKTYLNPTEEIIDTLIYKKLKLIEKEDLILLKRKINDLDFLNYINYNTKFEKHLIFSSYELSIVQEQIKMYLDNPSLIHTNIKLNNYSYQFLISEIINKISKLDYMSSKEISALSSEYQFNFIRIIEYTRTILINLEEILENKFKIGSKEDDMDAIMYEIINLFTAKSLIAANRKKEIKKYVSLKKDYINKPSNNKK